jgi:hypothetical protein
MEEHDWLAQRFEANRTHLRAVAYRMLGSLSEADDALQEAWLHLSRPDNTSGLSLCTKPTSPLLHPSVSPALTTSEKVAGSIPVSHPFRKPSSSSMNAKVGERGVQWHGLVACPAHNPKVAASNLACRASGALLVAKRRVCYGGG